MITLNLLNKSVQVTIRIESSVISVIKSNDVMFEKSGSPYHIRIEVDDELTVCNLWYDLESYSVRELGESKKDLPDCVTNILVDDKDERLSILFIKDGKFCQFDGKIIRD